LSPDSVQRHRSELRIKDNKNTKQTTQQQQSYIYFFKKEKQQQQTKI
jgi:hypothetical protein